MSQEFASFTRERGLESSPSAEVLSFSTIMSFQRSPVPYVVLSLWTQSGPFNACLCLLSNFQWGLPHKPSFCLVVSPPLDGELFLAWTCSYWFGSIMSSPEWKCLLFPQTNYPASLDGSWFWWELSHRRIAAELLKCKDLRRDGLGAFQKPRGPSTCHGLSQSHQPRTPKQLPQAMTFDLALRSIFEPKCKFHFFLLGRQGFGEPALHWSPGY